VPGEILEPDARGQTPVRAAQRVAPLPSAC
jgi:hypothetical protein